MTLSRRTALTLLASVPIVAAMAGCADRDERDRLRLFDAVWKAVEQNYYDAAALDSSWAQARRLWRPRAARAESRAELYLAVLIPMLEQLNASHIQLQPSSTLLMPLNRSLPIPAMRRGQAPFYLTPRDEAGMGARLTWDGERLIVTEIDREGPAWVAGLRTGDPVWARRYRASQTGGRLALINHRNNAETVLEWERRAPPPARSYEPFGERSAVIRFDGFDKPSIDWLLDKLAGGHDAVVLDLRSNRGGLISECHRALSALLTPETEVGTFRSRQREYHVRTSPKASVTASRLVVLVGMRTMSAGEILADCLKRHRGAILVGARSAGAVLLSQDYPLPDGWKIRLPYADFVTSGGNHLEGSGVTPDIQTPSLEDGELLQKARSLALPA